MPSLIDAYELVDGKNVARQMYPVDVAHAVKVDPERWSYAPHKLTVAEPAPAQTPEPAPAQTPEPAPAQTPEPAPEPVDLPMLTVTRGPGRPRKDGGAG